MVELWLVDLARTAPSLLALERHTPRLTAEDAARAGRLKDPAERRLRLATYAALRVLLEQRCGPQMRRARIVRSPEGRPRLATPGPALSLSHAGALALIGLADADALGVDLETPRALAMSPRRRAETLAVGRGLASSALPAGDMEAMLQAWCRLEACAKARGSGISALLGELGLRVASGRTLPLPAIKMAAQSLIRTGGLAVRDVAMPKGVIGAVAAIGAPRLGRAPAARAFPTTPATIEALLQRLS